MFQAHTLGEEGVSVYPGKEHALCPIINDQFLESAEGHTRYHILCLGFWDLELVRCIVKDLRQLEIKVKRRQILKVPRKHLVNGQRCHIGIDSET